MTGNPDHNMALASAALETVHDALRHGETERALRLLLGARDRLNEAIEGLAAELDRDASARIIKLHGEGE